MEWEQLYFLSANDMKDPESVLNHNHIFYIPSIIEGT